jgi:hypothetical protein
MSTASKIRDINSKQKDMKKILSKLFVVGIAILLVTSCDDNYPVVYDESNIIIGLNTTVLTISEDEEGEFEIYLGGASGIEATNVTLQVSVDGIDNPAVEGVDFTLSTKNINLQVGTSTVTVIPINDEVFTGDRQFKISIAANSKNYPVAAENTILVTILEDDHPLSSWIGTYDVEALSTSAPGDFDETWTVTTVAGDVPMTLKATGIAFGNGSVVIKFNIDDNTVEIESGQNLGDIYAEEGGPFDGTVYYATDDITGNAGDYTDASFLAAAKAISMTGTFNDEGVIQINRMAIILDEYVYCWDVFDTTWTIR